MSDEIKAPPTNAIDSSALLAFRTSALGENCVVFAKTRGRAKMATVNAANDAGYNINITNILCRRDKYIDGRKTADGSKIVENKCYVGNALFE